ncbi:MAG TPA: hypothetical protein VEK77_13910 [Gemmatimonadales bacterium]|nr:hypothetical protein [Gemmatimonadales bacterium]
MKRVLVECRDLFFRAKLQEVVRTAGAEPTRDEPFDVAVVELGNANGAARIRELVQRGITVLAFGSHVDAAALRAARDLGARAVPNSEIENALRALV